MAKVKAAKNDFQEENLPQTRKDQFFDLLKNQYKVIFLIGLMFLLFFLPLLSLNVVKAIMANKAYALIDLNKASVAQVNDAVGVNRLIFDLANFIFYPLLFVGVGGLLRVTRQLIHGEPVIFKYDFNKGIKDNSKTFIFIGLFVSLLKLIFDLLIVSLGSSILIEIIAYTIFYTAFLPPFIVMCAYSSIYQNKFFTSLKQSLLLYLRGSWKFLGAILLILIPYVLLQKFFPFIVFRQIVYILLIVFALPLVMIIGYMIMYSTFDKLINIRLFPEIWRKGLYVSELEKEEMRRTKKELEQML